MALYLNIHLAIDNSGGLKTKLYNKLDDFTLQTYDFPFTSGHIPVVSANGAYVYNFQLVPYSRDYVQ